jgi:hypothetical protein
MIKLNENITHELLIHYGFKYRKHYDNYIYMIGQPRTKKVFKELLDMGYTEDKAKEENSLKQTYIDYFIQIDLKEKKISVWSHALNKYPHEESLYQYDIPSEVIEVLFDMLKKRIIIIEKEYTQ